MRVMKAVKQTKSSFKWRRFEPSPFLVCVRWYCRYQPSHRDLEAMHMMRKG
jgi:transposase-like protein